MKNSNNSFNGGNNDNFNDENLKVVFFNNYNKNIHDSPTNNKDNNLENILESKSFNVNANNSYMNEFL